jgi:hypothetical protein
MLQDKVILVENMMLFHYIRLDNFFFIMILFIAANQISV